MGEKEYKWPYYHPRSKERIQGSEKLALRWAREADRIIEKHDKRIALICMEELDEPMARNIKNKMKNPEMVKIFLPKQYNASQITHILRSLETLITSRYHASVLSIEALIPQIAIGHDPRLKGLYMEMGLENYLLDRFSPKLWHNLMKRVDELLENPKMQKKILKEGFVEHFNRASRNPMILKDFLRERSWKVKT